ncbi:hypothetical protein BH09VER1_BH09VER1_31000 [soil metagenome]
MVDYNPMEYLKIGNDLVNPDHVTKVTKRGQRVIVHLTSKGGPNANLLVIDDKPGEDVWTHFAKDAVMLVGETGAHAVHEAA